MFCGINLRAIEQGVLMNIICDIWLEITVLKLQEGTNELIHSSPEHNDYYPGNWEYFASIETSKFLPSFSQILLDGVLLIVNCELYWMLAWHQMVQQAMIRGLDY